ncbi:DDE superfamily endonuclease [Phytophthora infestans]|uniref:DDE superfamily endonuclease n=1 Tax=Phytophthora infestans TaxID=4787 RepID=A0A833W4W0_PHYIN|nr:DDE superfamily endonuclease [Phytophthora infestans]
MEKTLLERPRFSRTSAARRFLALHYWWKQNESIKRAPVRNLRLKGAGAKPRLVEVEDMIFDQVLSSVRTKKKTTRHLIADMAKQLAQSELRDTRFLGSSKAVCYMEYLFERKDRFNLAHTVLLDETAVYFEDPRRQTIDSTGARHVVLKSTGVASMRVTAVLAVVVSGQKLPPLVVWKGAQQDGQHERVGNSYVTYQTRACVDSQLLIWWLDLVFPPIFDASTAGKAIVWDSMRAHSSKFVKARFVRKDLQMFVIPGVLTLYVQAGDIGIYKSFKDKLSTIIDEWKSSDRAMYTKGSNPKKPPVEDVVQWVQTAWKAVLDFAVARSIAATGFPRALRIGTFTATKFTDKCFAASG